MGGKKKFMATSLAGIALLILLIFGYPAVKVEVAGKHYQWFGSYVYFPGETSPADPKPVDAETQSADYRDKGIKLTNVLYYPELRQLAFGYMYSDAAREKYDIALLDADGRRVPGTLLVSGSMGAYSKRLQKLNFMLEEPLDRQAAYTILITDEKGETAGSLEFAVRLR